MKIKPDLLIIRATNPERPNVAQFVDNEWWIKQDYNDKDETAGTFLILRADGSVISRTIDSEGFIIREIEVRRKKDA